MCRLCQPRCRATITGPQQDLNLSITTLDGGTTTSAGSKLTGCSPKRVQDSDDRKYENDIAQCLEHATLLGGSRRHCPLRMAANRRRDQRED
jgi:hypothetical protein